MILMLGCDVENISLNIDNIEKYITDGYNQLETTNNECCFYNRRKYKWKNIIHEILVINEGDEIKKTIGKKIGQMGIMLSLLDMIKIKFILKILMLSKEHS